MFHSAKKFRYRPTIIVDDNDNNDGGKVMALNYIGRKTEDYGGEKAGYSSVMIIDSDSNNEESYPQFNVGGEKGLFNQNILKVCYFIHVAIPLQ